MTEKPEAGLGEDREVAAMPLVNSKHHEPGRELDALIAEKVMGWTMKTFWPICDIRPDQSKPCETWKDADGSIKWDGPDRYSTKIRDAFGMAETLKFGWRATRYISITRFNVTVYRTKNDPDGVSAQAETLPLAFCLAALRAVDA